MEKTTVTVDYKRFRELEELEEAVKEANEKEGVIIHETDNAFGENIVRVLDGTEAINALIKEIKNQIDGVKHWRDMYFRLRDVVPRRYYNRVKY